MKQVNFDHLKVVFLSADGQQEEITGISVSMNIHEDVFAYGIWGNVLVQDPDFILERLNVKGEDKLIIEFSSGAKDGFYLFKKIVDIVSIDKLMASHKTVTYNINFQSQFLYAAQSYLMSTFVQGKTDEIVREIYEKHIRYDEPLISENCLYYREFIIPRWSALRTIEYLANTAQSGTNQENQNYVFFERSDGFMFFSLEGLRDLGVKEILKFANPESTVGKYEKNVVLDWNIQSWYNRDNLFKHGFFGSTVYGIDPKTKQFSQSRKRYAGQHNPAWTYSEQMAQVIAATNPNNAGVHDWGHKSNGAWNNLSVDVLINGNTNLTAGDMVGLEFPTYTFAEYNQPNKVLPNQWLVAHVHHQFFDGDYKQTLNLRSDKWN